MKTTDKAQPGQKGGEKKPIASAKPPRRSAQKLSGVSKPRRGSSALDEARLRKLNRTYAMLSDVNQTIVRVRMPLELFEAA